MCFFNFLLNKMKLMVLNKKRQILEIKAFFQKIRSHNLNLVRRFEKHQNKPFFLTISARSSIFKLFFVNRKNSPDAKSWFFSKTKNEISYMKFHNSVSWRKSSVFEKLRLQIKANSTIHAEKPKTIFQQILYK